MDLRIDTSEVAEMIRRTAAAAPIVREELGAGMRRATFAIEADAKRIVPVKTHHLQRSITSTVQAGGQQIVGVVGTNVPYATYVHDGRGPVVATRARALRFEIGGRVIFRKRVGPAKGKPFLRDALTKNRAAIVREFERVAERVAQRLSR